MSVGEAVAVGQEESSSTKTMPDTDRDGQNQPDGEGKPENSQSSTSSSSSLFGTLLSPLSSFLKGTPSQDKTQDGDSAGQPDSNQSATSNSNPGNGDTTASEKATPPEAYYTPNEVPLFKKLQKKRLTGTRTKQLLRAASRGHDDPPPPPELGTCCGSSCDPCVNDLWREERDVWRERWGDRAVEKDGGQKKNLEW